MSNFIEEFKKGQKGSNKGIPLGPGLERLSKVINGVQKHMMYGIGAAPKVGKSTFVDYAFLFQVYLYCIKHNILVEWIYFSFEIDRVSKEFDAAAFFIYHDFNIFEVPLPPGVTYTQNGVSSNKVPICANYLRGRLLDDNENVILVDADIKNKLKQVYSERITPLFGEYSKEGIQLKKGLVTFVEDKDNPTGLRNYLIKHAKKYGEFTKSSISSNKRITGFKRNIDAPDVLTIVITDHLRKLKVERGFNLKQTVDKYVDYTIELRNWCDFTFAHIIHTNRGLSDVKNIQFNKTTLYPTSDDIKDTGNLAEDADYMLTMFNCNDDKYKISHHFGLDTRDKDGNPYYPNMRSIHLVESRHCLFPQHFRTEMLGSVKSFKEFQEKQ